MKINVKLNNIYNFVCCLNLFFLAFSHCSGQTIGVGTPSSYAFNTDTSGVGYLLEDGIYQVTCCGYISRWDVFTSATGTVKLQLWRRTGTNSYTLIGKNELTASKSLFY